jgi:hypothetical protein
MSDAGLWSTETARREAASVAVVCAVQAHGSLLKELMPGVIGALKVKATTPYLSFIKLCHDFLYWLIYVALCLSRVY